MKKSPKNTAMRETIVEYLKSRQGQQVPGAEIDKMLGITISTRNNLMWYIKAEYPQIVNVADPPKPAMFMWDAEADNDTSKPTAGGVPMEQAKQNPVELESTTTMADVVDDGDFIDDDTAAAFSKPESIPLTSKIDVSKVKVTVEPPAPSLMKNAEGYNDPTAGAAIASVDKAAEQQATVKKGNKYPSPGEVWEIENEKELKGSKYSTSKYFVFHISDDMVYCLSLMPSNKPTYNNYTCKHKFTISVEFPTNLQEYYADASRIWFKQKRCCKKRLRDIDQAKLEEARDLIVHGLNLQDFVITKEIEKVVEKIVEKPVEVEKIVEKVVEKPVEVEKPIVPVSYVAHEAPEGCVLAKDAEIAMLKQELEIWKMLAQRYLPVGPGGVEVASKAQPVSQVIHTNYA